MSGATATVPLPYTREELEATLGADAPAFLERAYRWMLLGRTLDQRMLALQRQGRVGFYGPATGQEAVGVAAALASLPDDWVVPGLREQLVALVRGHPLARYMDHLFANRDDPAQGRQMPCHPTAREVNYVSMSSVIGTQIAHGVGVALGMQRRRANAAALVFFGDGATSANDFHAGLNVAGVFGLPAVFALTNNQWAISQPVAKQSRVARLVDKAAAYGIPGERVDGTDLVASYLAFRRALDQARTGGGPSLIELVTYRQTPHSSSDDPTRYQAPGWVIEAATHDPLLRLEALFDRLDLLPARARAAAREAADASVRSAIAAAEPTSPPGPGTVTKDVFAASEAPAQGAA
ncbi:MAG TPA: thiamine pyrophosphate-dependent enzyme [Thermoplasmata archaeon]|nr:thiamine pyrophosphate-dependent enzyme [Thermoplasmata archaeon]